MNFVHNEETVIEFARDGLDGILLCHARFGCHPPHQIGQFNVAHELVAGVDDTSDALDNAGTHRFYVPFCQIGQLCIGTHFFQQFFSSAATDDELALISVEFQLGNIK